MPRSSFLEASAGAVAVTVAMMMPALLGAAAFATDLGVLYLDRRDLQSASDLAAMAAVTDPSHAAERARRVLDLNGFAHADFDLSLGRYGADPALSPKDRFQPSGTEINAARIEATAPSRLFFARYFTDRTPVLGVASTAAVTAEASFSIGARLAAVKGGIANAVLTKLIGADLALSAVDYQSLASVSIGRRTLLQALARQNGAGDATSSSLLSTPVPLPQLVAALADAARQEGALSVGVTLTNLSRNLHASTAKATVLQLLASSGGGADTNAKLNLLDMLSAGLIAGSQGTRVALDLNVPGLSDVSIEMMLGEGLRHSPPNAVGGVGASAETAQLKLRLSARIGGQGLLKGLSINLPIEIVAGEGKASLTDIACAADPSARSATLAVSPGLVKAEIGGWTGPLASASMATLPQPAKLVDAGSIMVGGRIPVPALVTISARAKVASRNLAPEAAVFKGSEIGSGQAKTVKTRDFTRSIAAELVQSLDLDVGVLGAPLLSLPSLRGPLTGQLAGIASPLDDIINALLDLAGVGLGEADVRVEDVTCGTPRLTG